MTKDEFVVLVKGLRSAYQRENFLGAAEDVGIWYEMLKDLPYEIAHKSVISHISTNKFPPTIAEIRQGAARMVSPEIPTALDAWSLVYKAICNSSYHAEEEFAKLPPMCQKVIGNPANLREMATMDTNAVKSVEQSHFIKTYNTIAEREKETAALPENIRVLIGKTAERMIGNAQVS